MHWQGSLITTVSVLTSTYYQSSAITFVGVSIKMIICDMFCD